jgi:phage FluMu protein Com
MTSTRHIPITPRGYDDAPNDPALATSRPRPRRSGFASEVRCGCHRLLFRVVGDVLEVKCHRCQSVTRITKPELWPEDPSMN